MFWNRLIGLLGLALAMAGLSLADPAQLPKIDREGGAVVSERALRVIALEEVGAIRRSRATAGALLEVQGSADTLSRLPAAGFSPQQVSQRYGSALVRVRSVEQLQWLAQQPGMLRVDTLEPYVRRAGMVASRAPVALQATNTDLGRADGQTVAIISDSFARTNGVRDANTTPGVGESGDLQGSQPQDSGDLPAVVKLLKEGDDGNTDEGAAMAELVHDMAPGAAIVFHAAGLSRAAFASAIDTICDGNLATIVVDDIGFLLEPYYQDGIVSQAAARCVAKGIPFVSAAGNDGDQAYRRNFIDIYPEVDDEPDRSIASATGVDLHNWGDGDVFLSIRVPKGEKVFAVLQWNQPNATVNATAGAQIDMDLYATRSDTIAALSFLNPAHVGRSIEVQGTTGNPLGNAAEFLELTAPAQADDTFYLAVEHHRGSQQGIPQAPGVPLEFRLLLVGATATAEYPFDGPTIWGHPMAEGVVSVAAVPWWESPPYAPSDFGSPDIDPEPYSGRGGSIPIQFDGNGGYQAVERFVPTLSGVDANNTTFFGSDFTPGSNPGFGEPDGHPNFFGTSAAAPNIAGLMALLKSRFPSLSVTDLQDGLIATAIDVTGSRAAAGTDSVSGAGLVSGEAALAFFERNQSAPPQQSPTPQNVTTDAPSGGGGGGGSGCFIATAAWGSAWSEEVRLLREFRDRQLRRYAAGRWVIAQYYRYSPAIAEQIKDRESLKLLVRASLTPVIYAIRYPLLLAGLILALLVIALSRHTPRLATCSR